MTSSARSWRLLVGLKQRRTEREREVVRGKLAALTACAAELQNAQDQLSRASSHHAQARQRMMEKLGGTKPFKPEIVPLLREDVERCELAARRAADEVKVKETQCAQAQEALRQAKAAVARTENQLQQAREQLSEVLAQVERESDDATDEDAEETAVARMRRDRNMAEADTDPYPDQEGRMQ